MRKRRRMGLYWLAVALALAATSPWSLVSLQLRANIQNLLFDQFQRWRPRVDPPSTPVRIVEIDDESIHRLGQWPWPRSTMAALIDVIGKADAAALAIDFLFSENERGQGGDAPQGEGDAAFARSLAGRPVVLGQFLTEAHSDASPVVKAGFASAGDNPLLFLHEFYGVLTPLPILAQNAAAVGFLNWLPDNDRVVRRVPLVLNVNGKMVPSLALEALRVAQGASTYLIKASNASGEYAFGAKSGVNTIKDGDALIPTESGAEFRVYYAEDDPRRVIPAWKALEPGADLSDLSGKIVFLGVSASLLSDIVGTTLHSAQPGVDTHAQIVEQILTGTTLTRPDWAPGAEFVATLALALSLALALPFMSALVGGILGGVAAAAYAWGSWYAFATRGLLLDPMIPTLSSGFVFLVGALALYGLKRREEREMRSAFGRYVSPAVVARLAENPEALQLGGQQRELTLMFCDIRSFTSLSEGMSATELTSFLNEYLSPMTDAVLDLSGTVDKYMGDAIMAFWNAPLDDPRHGPHAVAAALRMRRLLADLNAEWRRRAEALGRGFTQVRFGVGLNTGECCVGNLGSVRRFDYSAIGDEVNVASRLEGASKMFGVDIVASEATRDEARGFAWVEIDEVLLKNKTRPVGVYALVGDEDYAASAEFREFAAAHDAMLADYRARRFEAARGRAADLGVRAPEWVRGLYFYNERRFAALIEEAPSQDWRALISLDEK